MGPGGRAPGGDQEAKTLKLKVFENLGVQMTSHICQLLCILPIQ